MDNSLYDMIFRRKSFHRYVDVGDEKLTEEELQDIMRAWTEFTPLCPEIRTAIHIVPAKETSCKRGNEYSILIYSEKKEHYLQNIGYLGEQLDLYLTSKNIGPLWFGVGRTKERTYDGLDYVIMMGIKKLDTPARFRKDFTACKRKSVGEIWEGTEIAGVTGIVRYTPSACNSQPWYVVNDGTLTVYRRQKPGGVGIMPFFVVSYFNRIDMGIFLCFLELCLEKQEMHYKREIFPDDGKMRDRTLNAVYRFE